MEINRIENRIFSNRRECLRTGVAFLLFVFFSFNVFGVDTFSIPRKKQETPISYEIGKRSSGGRKSSFYGIPVNKNEKIIFIIDLSGSMGSRTPEGLSRLEAMKKELISMLTLRPRDDAEKMVRGSFFILEYESNVKYFPPEKSLYPFNSILHVETAVKHIQKLSANGGTAMGAAWNAVFKLTDVNEINTIFFLTDGEPTDCTEADVLQMVNAWNSKRKIKINCIAIGRESNLLHQLAKDNGGIYRVRM